MIFKKSIALLLILIGLTLGPSIQLLQVGVSQVEAAPALSSNRCFSATDGSQTDCPDSEGAVNFAGYKAGVCYRIVNVSGGRNGAITLNERTCTTNDVKCYSNRAATAITNCPSSVSDVSGNCYYINGGDELNGASSEKITCPVAAAGGGSSGGSWDDEPTAEDVATKKPPCDNSNAVGATDGTCSDSFTRCPIGSLDKDGNVINDQRYGQLTSNNECFEFDPDDVPPLEENPILIFMGRIISFLSAGVGILLVVMMIIAGIRYTLARGNPQESAASKGMIEKIVISVIMYLFAFALINWLIPGGIL